MPSITKQSMRTPQSPNSVIAHVPNPYIARESNHPGRKICYQVQVYPVLKSTRTPNKYAIAEDQLDELTARVAEMTIADPTDTVRSLPKTTASERHTLGRFESRAVNRKTGETKLVMRSARLATKQV